MNINDLEHLIRQLPEIPGIQGRSRYCNSAVLVPLVAVDQQFHLLFQKRSATIRQPGEVCFPGGKFDPQQDAGYQETAVRETIEELGIDPAFIKVKGCLNTMMAAMGVIIEPFLAILEIAAIDQLNPDPAEVERVFTVPVSHFTENEPETYRVRVEVQPSYVDSNGQKHILFPAKDLGLPKRYHNSWGGKVSRMLV